MSSAPKRGLGRGLGALLGDQPGALAQPAASARGPAGIPVDRIYPNPHQPRKHFDQETLRELQSSIAEHGVLVPILVRERGDRYELIAGERRWRASAALGRETIPAIVRPDDDRTSLEVAIVENLQRENLNALEEAAGIADLIEAHGYTQEQAAQRLGKSRPSVANALRLLALPEPIKALIAAGGLDAGHAKALLAAPEAARMVLADRAASQGLSVRAIERIVQQINAPPRTPQRTATRVTADERAFEDRLRMRLGAAVSLRRQGKGGSIEVRFANDDDLIRIAELLLGE